MVSDKEQIRFKINETEKIADVKVPVQVKSGRTTINELANQMDNIDDSET